MATYFDYNLLKNANDKAVKLGFNRAIEDEFFEDIDPKTLFPVVFAVDHNDGTEMRVRFIYNEAGDGLFIDMLHEDFLALPNASGGSPFV